MRPLIESEYWEKSKPSSQEGISYHILTRKKIKGISAAT
jgi:hypothetical protein